MGKLTAHGRHTKWRVRVLEIVQTRQRIVVAEARVVHEVGRGPGVVHDVFKRRGLHCSGIGSERMRVSQIVR